MIGVRRPGCGLDLAGEAIGWRQVPMICMYHAVADEPEDPNGLCVTPARFAEQMAWLAGRGLRGVGVGTLLAALRAGKAAGLVGISFDDGYRSVLAAALPVLQCHGFGATAFVLSDPASGTNSWDAGPQWPLLTPGEIGELARGGVEIGSHGARHVRLPGLGPAVLAAELKGSRHALVSIAGTDVVGFAYPWGDMDPVARRAVAAAGYGYACAVATPRRALGMMALPRIYIGEQDGPMRLALKRRLFRLNSIVKGKGR